jgi:hypothetical protein
MGSRPVTGLLHLPIRMHGIQLGQPIDVLLDVAAWQTLGFVVRCGDEATRFLPYAACNPTTEDIAVQSALMLLEDVTFYEKRGVSFRSLLDGTVGVHGSLVDAWIAQGGAVAELEVERDGTRRRVSAAGQRVTATRASAA